jgi:pimeloyl-ACP methyl ester carboxylesterase
VIDPVEGISRTEIPLRFFAGHGDSLFGILTRPMSQPRGVAVVLLNAATDRNRFLPRLARRLAARGFDVLRFDYRGFGESSGPWTGSEQKHALMTLSAQKEPFADDAVAAVEELQRRGYQRFVFVGRCFGARSALAAGRHVPNLQGIVLISMPIHVGEAEHPSDRWALDHVRGAARRGFRLTMLRSLFSRRRRERWVRVLRQAGKQLVRRRTPKPNGAGEEMSWISESVIDGFRDTVSRHIPLLLLYGADEIVYKDFELARSGALGSVLGQAGAAATIRTLDGPVRILSSVPIQEEVMQQVIDWIDASVPASDLRAPHAAKA